MSLEQRLFANAMKAAQLGDSRGYMGGGDEESVPQGTMDIPDVPVGTNMPKGKAIIDKYADDVLSESSSSAYGGRRSTKKYKSLPNGTKGAAMYNPGGPINGGISGGFPFAALLIPGAISVLKNIIQGSGDPSLGYTKPIRGSGLSGGDFTNIRKSLETLLKMQHSPGILGVGLSGGMPSGGYLNNVLPSFGASGSIGNMGDGVTGGAVGALGHLGNLGNMGYDVGPGYGSRYPGSFPMPGFSPPPDGWQGYGHPGSSSWKPVMQPMGSSLGYLSGGSIGALGHLGNIGNLEHTGQYKPKPKCSKAPKEESEWIKSCKEYMHENGCSYKDAMIALKKY